MPFVDSFYFFRPIADKSGIKAMLIFDFDGDGKINPMSADESV